MRGLSFNGGSPADGAPSRDASMIGVDESNPIRAVMCSLGVGTCANLGCDGC